MINKEFKNEAKSYAKRKFSEEEQAYLHDIITQAYYAGAEPREKRIVELEAQIEKMKSCRSCKHDNHCNHRVCDKSLPFWELRR